MMLLTNLVLKEKHCLPRLFCVRCIGTSRRRVSFPVGGRRVAVPQVVNCSFLVQRFSVMTWNLRLGPRAPVT